MLFNTPVFIFIYLPIVLAGFFILGRFRLFGAAAGWTAIASLVFYGWNDWGLLPLICASIVFNFVIGRALAGSKSLVLLWVGLCGNIGLLGWFKYAGFFAQSFNLLGASVSLPEVVLPVGISFFTFTQIAFLVDAFRGEAKEYRFVHYVLFVSYFPHLIAGPILHHKEMMPQFARPETYRLDLPAFALGLSWFTAGLFKKAVLADRVAPYADAVFGAAAKAHVVSAGDAWAGVLSYSLQLYFDFSGYSDMAIGLALMMGITLPLNFNSPYKAASIIDFWRRWHITLSRFLRDYLYIPLGGSRNGALRRYVNLFITMLLGGLWHGASWNFVVWGGIHGSALAINNVWRSLGLKLPTAIAHVATLTFVTLAWVPFRAKSMTEALNVWVSMLDLRGKIGLELVPPFEVLWIVALLAVAVLCPNTQQIFSAGLKGASHIPRWRPTVAWAMLTGSAFGLSVSYVFGSPTSFLYFRF